MSFKVRNRSTFDTNQFGSSVVYELSEDNNVSNFVTECRTELLNNDSVDSLVYNTNNSAVYLKKTFHIRVPGKSTLHCSEKSLDTSSYLDSSSDRPPANSKTHNTVANESHNYLYSNLSYFSDMSDHNSQVINMDKDDISQTNDVTICNQS